MFRVFSGSCLSLDDMETVLRTNLVQCPHILGPGVDFFTPEGVPVCPLPGVQRLQKVFSGSALDLNAANGDAFSEDDMPLSPLSPLGLQRTLPVSTILNQLSSEAEKEKSQTLKSKTHVLVIGDNGYIMCHVVAKLLEAGYSVRATVPTMTSQQHYQQQHTDMYNLSRDSAQRLTIVEADTNNSIALRDAIRGCRYVIHCGCSLATTTERVDPIKYHMDAIQALFDGIRLSGRSTVKRVIVTGSASSVFHITDPDTPSGAFDEQCWNRTATAESDPVPTAKILFEKEAWRLRQMIGVELVVLLPSILIGPSRTMETSEAMIMMHTLASVKWYLPFCPNLYWNYVDVRDLAEAHVRALENNAVQNQRVIVSNGCYNLTDLTKIIKRRYPHLSPPTRTSNTLLTLMIGVTQAFSDSNLRSLWRSLGVRKRLDNRRATTELGLTFTPIEETVSASIDQMIRAGELPAAKENRGCVSCEQPPPQQQQQNKCASSPSRHGLTVSTALLVATTTVVWLVRRRRGS